MDEQKTLMEFPCTFPIKIIGKNSWDFVSDVKKIIFTHFLDTPEEQISYKQSETSKYIAITVVLYVETQASLDALYQELSAHPDMHMVL